MSYITFTEEEKKAIFEHSELVYTEEDDLEEDEESFADSLDEEFFFFEDFLAEELAALEDELDEKAITRHVSSTGKITKRANRQIRKRRATQTTGRSPSDRRRSARKAVRTKRRNVSGQRKALRKRRKALRRRKSLNIK